MKRNSTIGEGERGQMTCYERYVTVYDSYKAIRAMAKEQQRIGHGVVSELH